MNVFSTATGNVNGSLKQCPGGAPKVPSGGRGNGPLLTVVRLRT